MERSELLAKFADVIHVKKPVCRQDSSLSRTAWVMPDGPVPDSPAPDSAVEQIEAEERTRRADDIITLCNVTFSKVSISS